MGKGKYSIPWHEMQPGDSVVVELVSHVDGRPTIYRQARARGIKISAAKEYAKDGSYLGLRVWVIKKTKLGKK